MTENPLALRSIDTLGVRHRRDAYATLDAGSEPQRVHIKLARHTETGNLCSSQTTRNSEPRTRNRATEYKLKVYLPRALPIFDLSLLARALVPARALGSAWAIAEHARLRMIASISVLACVMVRLFR